MRMSDFVLALFGAALINLIVLEPDRLDRHRLHALGLCSALLIALALPIGLQVQHLPGMTRLQGLQLFLWLPLLAGLAWGLPRLLQRLRPGWPLSGLTPLLLGNGAALGLMLQLGTDSSLWRALRWGLLGGLGFWVALWLMAELRERSQAADVPPALRGLPITLIGAGIMALACVGLSGVLER